MMGALAARAAASNAATRASAASTPSSGSLPVTYSSCASMMTTAASLAGVPPFALLALPLAFTAAMTLCDSLNGVAMMRMYRSALDDPQRRLGFNALVTGISAVSALFIAAITLGGFANAAFALEDPLTVWLGSIDLGDAGLLLVALLLAVWGAAGVKGRLAGSRRR